MCDNRGEKVVRIVKKVVGKYTKKAGWPRKSGEIGCLRKRSPFSYLLFTIYYLRFGGGVRSFGRLRVNSLRVAGWGAGCGLRGKSKVKKQKAKLHIEYQKGKLGTKRHRGAKE